MRVHLNPEVGCIVMDDTQARIFCTAHYTRAISYQEQRATEGHEPCLIVMDRRSVDRLATEQDEGVNCSECGLYL